jgi:predicted nucleotidyltransferase
LLSAFAIEEKSNKIKHMNQITIKNQSLRQRDRVFYISEIQKLLPNLRKKYPIKSLGIFGSYVRNEEASLSDLDILVEFDQPIGLFAYIELESDLSKRLGIKVDLVSKGALFGKIGQHILSEVVYL